QSGLTLIEIMIAIAILALMMTMAWTTTRHTSQAASQFEAIQNRNREIRVGLARIVADLESAYLSQNEDMNATDRRTLFVARGGAGGGRGARIRFLGPAAHAALVGRSRVGADPDLVLADDRSRRRDQDRRGAARVAAAVEPAVEAGARRQRHPHPRHREARDHL